MNKKTIMHVFTLVIVLILTNGIVKVYSSKLCRTYYIDSEKGNDVNIGTSLESPWKTLNKINTWTFSPGDSILFRSGKIWNGQLWPKGSGSEKNPIIIDRYGKGEKPILNSRGLPFTVCLFNQEYWNIQNLELINFNKEDSINFKRRLD